MRRKELWERSRSRRIDLEAGLNVLRCVRQSSQLRASTALVRARWQAQTPLIIYNPTINQERSMAPSCNFVLFEPLALEWSRTRVDCGILVWSMNLSVLSLSRRCWAGTSATRSMVCFSPAYIDTVWRSWARSRSLLCLCWRGSTNFWKANCQPASPPTPATKPPQVLKQHGGAITSSTLLLLGEVVRFTPEKAQVRTWLKSLSLGDFSWVWVGSSKRSVL